MKVIDHLEDFSLSGYSVVTIGTFDGVHIGHQAILRRLIKEAKANDGSSILITFWPHPRFILKKDTDLKLLSTFDEKIRLIESLGVDYILKIAFTPEFSYLSADEFVKEVLLRKVNTKKLFIGYDHHFGNHRKGNIEFLRSNASNYGFEVREIPRQDIDSIGISSTKIRNALLEGDVAFAKSLLGRNYSIEGKVMHGEKNGRKIGFPTANIQIEESCKLLPADGVYAVKASLGHKAYGGMLNIGFKPTLKGSQRTIEAHLFNFQAEIYDRELKVEFIRLLRKEIKFHSIEELKSRLERDKSEAQKVLS
ncbi:MAG: bifunctional riboflavin kinase/FAD synthetase [Ekhidna sp.]|nr:bifunctional riboflavin kinase/FAD synthetase [Ekhidna sp.]